MAGETVRPVLGPHETDLAKLQRARRARALQRERFSLATEGEGLARALGFTRADKAAHPEPADDAAATTWWRHTNSNLAAYVRTSQLADERRRFLDEEAAAKRLTCDACGSALDPSRDAVLADHLAQADHLAETLAKCGFRQPKGRRLTAALTTEHHERRKSDAS